MCDLGEVGDRGAQGVHCQESTEVRAGNVVKWGTEGTTCLVLVGVGTNGSICVCRDKKCFIFSAFSH